MNNDNKNEIPINKKEAIDRAIDELSKLGININNNNYVNERKFKDLYNELYINGDHLVSYAWWIEQNIVGQERLEQIYGPYSLKVSRKLTDEERKKTNFYKYISELTYSDSKTTEEVRKYFCRNESNKLGLIKRLQQAGFDIEILSKTLNNQDDYLRLLYFLYTFEKGNSIELTPFLTTPTLENEDSRFNILNTRNGKYIGEIKENISYAIDPDYVINLNQTYFKIET